MSDDLEVDPKRRYKEPRIGCSVCGAAEVLINEGDVHDCKSYVEMLESTIVDLQSGEAVNLLRVLVEAVDKRLAIKTADFARMKAVSGYRGT